MLVKDNELTIDNILPNALDKRVVSAIVDKLSEFAHNN